VHAQLIAAMPGVAIVGIADATDFLTGKHHFTNR
jgi:hypothetical protein